MERMSDRFPIEVHGPDRTVSGWYQHPAYPVPDVLTRGIFLLHLAINSDGMVPRPEKKSKVLCKRLEPAVLRRNTAGPQYQNVHAIYSSPKQNHPRRLSQAFALH
jgi:hypothetical protein